MSKMDGLRAMREARYQAAMARTETPAKVPTAPVRRAPRPAADEPIAADGAGAEVCGHRAISGKTCTREQGHASKSHRYS